MTKTSLRQIPLSYNNADSERSALRLVWSLFPEWETEPGEVHFTRFTDGITNTLLKASKNRPGRTPEQNDEDSILLRAYGRGTEVLIDREKETKNHLMLAERGLAPPLLAQFTNGLLYRFIRGTPCSAHDLQQEPVWRAVAWRLAEWHARMPVRPEAAEAAAEAAAAATEQLDDADAFIELALPNYTTRHTLQEINRIAPGKLMPNPWTIMQKWIFALPGDEPAHSEADRALRAQLQTELHRVVAELADLPGIGTEGMVLAHCDLLCGNVIVQPPTAPSAAASTATPPTATPPTAAPLASVSSSVPPTSSPPPAAIEAPSTAASTTPQAPCTPVSVAFIDYEYATPAPAAFDLANHFAEWGGLDCDHDAMPTRSVRRAFLRAYLASYRHHGGVGLPPATTSGGAAVDGTDDPALDALCEAVDRFRGLPGLYWGLWARIQALISQIDFDYAAYAERRFSEYWGWRATEAAGGVPQGRREQRWATP